jgi:hypothetical protein
LALVLGDLVFDVSKAAGNGFDDKDAKGHARDHIVHWADDMSGLSVGFLIDARFNQFFVFDSPAVFKWFGDLNIKPHSLLELDNDGGNNILVRGEMVCKPDAATKVEPGVV